MSLSKIVGNLR